LRVQSPRKKNTSPHPPPCTKPWNPMFSCMLEPSTLLTSSSLAIPQALLLKTASYEYSTTVPTAQMLPHMCHPLEQTFPEHLLTHGSSQDSYLNTRLLILTLASPQYLHERKLPYFGKCSITLH
uniref:Uncharacterized protein n=1 Tax=Meleagris gallopavo TaxID=9103 RepID=A0A803XSR7_MELGA